MESNLEKVTNTLFMVCSSNISGIHFALNTLNDMREHRCDPEVFECMAKMVESILKKQLSTNEMVLSNEIYKGAFREKNKG